VSQASRVVAPEVRPPSADTVCSASDGTEADLSWALSIVSRAFRLTAGSSVADLPGGLRGYLVLTAVAQGQPRSQLSLAQQLAVDKTAMTYLLDELETAGLVTRRPDPADRRARQIAVTPKGSKLLAEFARRLTEAEAKVLAPLSISERRTLRELLGRVANSAQSGAEACTEADVQPC
jgi:DNA-binding MarR family transcriptional regulator